MGEIKIFTFKQWRKLRQYGGLEKIYTINDLIVIVHKAYNYMTFEMITNAASIVEAYKEFSNAISEILPEKMDDVEYNTDIKRLDNNFKLYCKIFQD